MAYATQSDRKALKDSNTSFDACPFVVRFRKDNRESELTADNVDQALNIQSSWIDKGADYVEIFRVLYNGELNPTIGAYHRPIVMVGDSEQMREDCLRATM